MDSKSTTRLACVTVCTFLATSAPAFSAAELSVTVLNAAGAAVKGAVVVAEPVQSKVPQKPKQSAVMDQRDLQYVPDVLVIQTGTAVEFPNSDNVRHQVYSFSSAKAFQLALYKGDAHAAITFDRPGLVTLGCNIHDAMVGYIFVTDSPWYGRTDERGSLQLHELAAGAYTVRLWHPLMDEGNAPLQTQIELHDGTVGTANFQLKRPLHPALHSHGADSKWADY